MKEKSKTREVQKKCDLCEQTMNPTVHIYKDQTCLCKACFGHMQQLPERLVKSLERYLIGNAV